MTERHRIINLLKQNELFTKRHFGQNFLINDDIIQKIVALANIEDQDVIEIGPGFGSLTQELVKKSRSLTAYEIDRDIIFLLKDLFQQKTFHLINQDFLKSQFDYDGKKMIVANIPYNITAKIIFKMFENNHKITRAIIMVQKEVADRIMAQVNTKPYGKFAITCECFANIKKILDVGKNNFLPIPKVDSTVIEFQFKNVNYQELLPFINFVKESFSQRRKTLVNNLKKLYGKPIVLEAIKTMGKMANIRPQELNLEEFKKMYSLLINGANI